jgi:glycosyltransferase involved in cell wall biosynthesis
VRSLVLLQNLPVPVRQGLDLRAWAVIDALAHLGPVAVFGVRSDDTATAPLPGIEVWASSGDRALSARDPIAQLASLGDSAGSPGDFYYSDQAGAEVSALVESFDPVLVVVQELRLHRYLDVLDRSRTAVVLDLPALASDLAQAQADAAIDRVAAILRRRMAARWSDLEARLLPAVDQVWLCSAVDSLKVASRHPSAATAIVPNTIAVDRYWGAPDRLLPLRIVFPATFAFQPNEDAAMQLIEEVMPRVRESEPTAELVLIGSHVSRRLAAAIEAAGARHRGSVPEIQPHLATSSVMAAPLTVASGTRYKLLEAFASRLPVVSTALAAEGLEVEDGVHLVLAEDPASCASGILRTWSDAALRSTLTSAAFDLVSRCYSYAASRRAVAAATAQITR